MTDTPPMSRIIALRSLDVDGVRIDEGTQAEIRAELVPALLDCGAVDLWIDVASGMAAGEASASGSVPPPPVDGTLTPATDTASTAGGDTSTPDAVSVGGEAATDAAPASSTLPGGATPDSAGASPVDAAEGGVAPEAPGAPAPPPAEAEGVPGGALDAAAAAARGTRRGKRA